MDHIVFFLFLCHEGGLWNLEEIAGVEGYSLHFLSLLTVDFNRRLKDDSFVSSKVPLQLRVVGFFIGFKGCDILEGSLEHGRHFEEKGRSVFHFE